MKKHFWCHLEYEGHRISVHYSAWSGKEIIYINDHPVSEKRNLLRFTGKHSITLDKVPYTIELELLNPFTYSVELRLKKGARTIARKQQKSIFLITPSTWFRLAGALAGFMLTGFVIGFFFFSLLIG